MPASAPTKLSVIFAGEDHVARFIDGGPAATTVRVRAMPARHLARVLQLADKEAELLDFVCFAPVSQPGEPGTNTGPSADGNGITSAAWQRVPEGWADNLTDESHAELYEAAKRLNFSRAATWAERQIAAKQFTGELALKAEEALMPMMQQIVGLLGSLSRPPSTPAAPSTKS